MRRATPLRLLPLTLLHLTLPLTLTPTLALTLAPALALTRYHLSRLLQLETLAAQQDTSRLTFVDGSRYTHRLLALVRALALILPQPQPYS